MAADNFYAGPGVFRYKGAEYGAGEKLPADLPKDVLESLAAKNRISGEAPAVTEKKQKDPKLVIAQLQAKIQFLEAQVEKAGDSDKVKALESQLATAVEAGKTLEGQLAEANKTIDTLTAQITAGPEAAGPKAKNK